MGEELYAASPAAREVFEESDDSLGFRLSEIIFRGTPAELRDTFNSQPAIMTVSIACWRAWQEDLGSESERPAAVAGHVLVDDPIRVEHDVTFAGVKCGALGIV